MRINQAQTAIQHFHSPDFGGSIALPLQERILAQMARYPDLDFTIGELASLCGLDKSTVSARRNEMLAADSESALIEHGPVRKCSLSGIRCQTVRLKRDGGAA